METAKLILYQVIGNGEFRSQTFNNSTDAGNVAAITRGIVVKIVKP